jgi:hypothetical protein
VRVVGMAAALVVALGATAFVPAPDPLVCVPVPTVNDDPCPEVVARWSNTAGEAADGLDQAADTALLDTGHVVTAASTRLADGRFGAAVVVVDVTSGSVVSETVVAVDDAEATLPSQVVGARDVAVVAARVDDGAAVFAVDTVAGTERWRYEVALDGATVASVTGLAMSPDGTRVYATTATGGSSVGTVGWLVTLDAATGEVRNEHRVRDAVGSRFARYEDVVVADDGRVFATGAAGSRFLPNAAMAVDAFDASGSLLWEQRLDGPDPDFNGHDGGDAIAVSGDGSTLVVTGTSLEQNRTQIETSLFTVALSTADGSVRWRSIRQPSQDPAGLGLAAPTTVAISPDGSQATTGAIVCAALVFACVGEWAGHDLVDGSVTWQHRTAGVGLATFADQVEYAPDGSVVRLLSSSVGAANYLFFNTAVGQAPTVSGHTPGFTVLTEVDSADGAVLWESRYNSGAAPTDYGFSGGMVTIGDDVLVAHTAVDTGEAFAGGARNRSDVELLRWAR